MSMRQIKSNIAENIDVIFAEFKLNDADATLAES